MSNTAYIYVCKININVVLKSLKLCNFINFLCGCMQLLLTVFTFGFTSLNLRRSTLGGKIILVFDQFCIYCYRHYNFLGFDFSFIFFYFISFFL